MDVAVDEYRAFYVVDQAAHRVQKFSSEGVLELVLGKPGARPGELRNPMGVAVNQDTGEIIVADTGNGRVQRFDSYGRFLGIIGDSDMQGLAAMSNPQAVTTDLYGRVYVADTLARRILQFDPLGRFLGYYGGSIGPNQCPGSLNLNLDEPRSLAVSDVGRLYIADAQRGAGRLSVLDVETGNLEVEISNAGKTLGMLARPSGIAVTPSALAGSSIGDVYVADTMNHRIIRFAWAV
jgi:DNA-binding beta-propeller fold protein YncE